MCPIANGKTIFTFTVITLAGLRALTVVFTGNVYSFRLPGDRIGGLGYPGVSLRRRICGRATFSPKRSSSRGSGYGKDSAGRGTGIYKHRWKFFIFQSIITII